MKELKDEIARVKLEIDHITEAMFNPLIIQYINPDYPECEPIKDIPHLNRLARTVLPELKQQLAELEARVNPPPAPKTLPKKRYSKTYHEYLSIKLNGSVK